MRHPGGRKPRAGTVGQLDKIIRNAAKKAGVKTTRQPGTGVAAVTHTLPLRTTLLATTATGASGSGDKRRHSHSVNSPMM